MKKRIRLTESDLHRIVKESVNKILSEVSGMPNAHKGKYVPAYWEKGEARRERSDYDENEEFVNEVLNNPVAHEDAYTLAGAAKGATKTLGGRLKGMFNPAWKARKERQYNAFADRGEELRNRLSTINKGNPYYNDSEEVDYDINARNNGYENPRRAAKQYGF